jgi:hypothetical protein
MVDHYLYQIAECDRLIAEEQPKRKDAQHSLECELMKFGISLFRIWQTLDTGHLKISKGSHELLSAGRIWNTRDIPLTAKELREKIPAETPPARVTRLIGELARVSNGEWPYLSDEGKLR